MHFVHSEKCHVLFCAELETYVVLHAGWKKCF
jgi:hypothetical protein